MNPDGSLHYTFMETLTELYPYWHMRAGGGVLYLLSLFIFIFNIIKTIQSGTGTGEAVRATGAV